MVNSGSNICLVTSKELLHNIIQYRGKVEVTENNSTTVMDYGDLYLLIRNNKKQYLVIIYRYYIMLSNKYNILGLSLFKKLGYKNAIHTMNKSLTLQLDSDLYFNISIVEIINSLDYTKMKVIPLPYSLMQSHRI